MEKLMAALGEVGDWMDANPAEVEARAVAAGRSDYDGRHQLAAPRRCFCCGFFGEFVSFGFKTKLTQKAFFLFLSQ